MSFNKRIYSIDLLTDIYENDGINGLKNNFKKVDAFIFEDNISNKVYKLIMNESYLKASDILNKELKIRNGKLLNKQD